MSKKPIKSNLFRFVTLRSPQLIEDKETGFVSFPEEKKAESLAFQAVQGATTDEERRTALKGAYSTNFTPIASRVEIKNLHEALYQFSGWLMRNKSVLSYASIDANLYAAQELTINEEFVLWENLFHQTISKESTNVREGLIQMLVANNFLKAFNAFTNSFSQGTEGEIVFTEENEKEFIRRVNASVIIPKEVLLSNLKGFGGESAQPSKTSQEHLASYLEVALAKDRIKLYESSLKEVEQAEMLYKKEESIRYDTELKTYEITIEQLQQDAVPEIQKILSEDGFSKELKIYPDLELPKFEFTYAPEINRDELGGVSGFSQETQKLLESEEFKKLTSFREVTSVLKEKINEEYKTVLESAPKETKKVNIAGAKVVVNPLHDVKLYSYFGGMSASSIYGYHHISMVLNVGVENVNIVSASYELKHSSGTTLSNNNVRKVSEINGLLSLKFFPDTGSLSPVPTGDCVFSGELTLSNGVKLSFSSSLFITKDYLVFGTAARYSGRYSGVGEVLEGGETSVESSNSKDRVLYGISQLGIVDFRRVEQEVCCYVPGEVSHIENIMAREYKERSTRDLRVSETITETTTEKEVENLTDTTSTERNELQSEASSVINKDKASSFGANASVSSDSGFIKFSAGANYNKSSSSSISNSNLQAQTYAQEVTERALERVVQKISTKRTSRMLREFEENNTHGFDNRKGDKHVTGVYRWVDKIYKNKLINYGKRLMYEFALPEPAKFYIKSYLEEKEESEKTPEGLIIPQKPENPKDAFGLKSAVDLTEYNYQKIASKYNASVKAPLEKQIRIGKSFAKDDQSYHAKGYSYNEIKVPEGYLANEGGVKFGGVEDRNAKPYISITLGDSNKVYYKGQGDASYMDFSNSYIGNVPFSYTAWNIHSANFAVTVECVRSDEAFNEWKNKTYKAIIDAYNERLQEYNDFIANQNIGGEPSEKKKELSSQINRSIEKRELKRIAIDLMTKPFDVVTARDNYKEEGKEVNIKHVARSSKFQEHAETVKFFEQAFDWEIMAYTFYPYFYGAEDNWDANFEYNEGNDPIFQAFLQSGMARSVVPVRPGFEEAVNWYMKTGEIWNGQGMVTDMDDDLYVSIAEEMQTIEGEVEGTWETRVPTTLTVLQADSVVLNEGGLPCNPDCEGQGLFDVSTYKIGDGPDGVDYDIVGDTNNVA